jgi:uncharacterized protein (DUF2062 family)
MAALRHDRGMTEFRGERSGVFHRHVGLPFETMLLQGASSRQIALAAATGATFGLFPVMGTTIPLCFAAAHVLKVPQTVTHAVNYAVYPIQIPLILVFARMGERMFGAPALSFSPSDAWALATTNPSRFFDEYGHEVLYAAAGWAAVAPLIFAMTFAIILFVVQRFRMSLPRR